jgi:hypothetical protein
MPEWEKFAKKISPIKATRRGVEKLLIVIK